MRFAAARETARRGLGHGMLASVSVGRKSCRRGGAASGMLRDDSSRRPPVREFPTLMALAAAALVTSAAGARAHAASFADDDAEPAAASSASSVDEGVALPFTLGARHDERAFVTFVSGYDWARETPNLELAAELHVWGPFSLRGGAVYTDDGDTLRPTVGVIWQAARRQQLGVDLALSVAYRPEGFTEPEGEIESVLAASRHFGALVGVVNLAYGQDPEANEQDAEARLAVLGRVARPLTVGVDSRLRLALKTKDGSPEDGLRYDLLAGPVATWAFDSWAVTAETGVSVLALDTGTRTGVSALVGLTFVR
jgi:hypothetical protein